MANHTLLKELQQKIDYQFKDENLLFTALTHSSYANEHKLHKIHHNERLEFLGDAVLEVVSSDFLFKNFPDMAEGQMSKKRASLVCEPTLAYCARQIGLGKYLMLGKVKIWAAAATEILSCQMHWRLSSVLFIWTAVLNKPAALL